MDSHHFIQSLSREQRVELTRRLDGPGLVHLAVHGGLILLLGVVIAMEMPGWPLLLLPQGIMIVFLFTLLHETSHRTAFRSGWLNTAVARVCGLLILLPPEWFRYFHFEHHRFTQDPVRDPELQIPKPLSLGAYFWQVSGIPLWTGQIRTLFRNAAGRGREAFVPSQGRAAVVREARLMILVYAALAGISVSLGSALLLYVWILPALLGQPFLRLYLLAEHGRCPEVMDVFASTRTTFTVAPVRKLAWNMPFHAEHHVYPAVPFHRLEQLHALTAPHLQETANGYLRFNRKYVAGLRR